MKRKLIQSMFTLATNAHITGFLQGRIYNGKLKNMCVPGLNCYSCPGALGSCPIGALQAVAASPGYGFSFYVAGLLLLFGLAMGRFVCGFLCPFGLIQELIHKIPFPRLRRNFPRARYLKYVVLLVLVLALPALMNDSYGIGSPTFCKYVCPAGTLTAGLPLVATNQMLADSAGWLFVWKLLVLGLVILGCLMVQRFFCKYLCPLGAIYSLFNRVSLYRLSYNPDTCINCGKCAKVCPMDVDPVQDQASVECIRCGECVKACPVDALKAGFGWKKVGEQVESRR